MAKALNCCLQFWRCVLIIIDAAFVLVGLALLALAIYLLVTQVDFAFITGTKYASGAVLLLVAGVITVLIAGIGLVGAAGLFNLLLSIYIGIMLVIVVLEITAGILGFVYQKQVSFVVQNRFTDALMAYRNETSKDYRSDVNGFIDFFQKSARCCGYLSPDDWTNTVYYGNSSGRYPASCLCSNQTSSLCVLQSAQTIWAQGCNTTLPGYLRGELVLLGGIGIAFGVIEIAGICVTIGLCACNLVVRRRKKSVTV
ncbi:hypothetical protein EMCRGX_G009034 [Ephydatia muelleri]